MRERERKRENKCAIGGDITRDRKKGRWDTLIAGDTHVISEESSLISMPIRYEVVLKRILLIGFSVLLVYLFSLHLIRVRRVAET
jgi:hypothetical protein